MAKLTKTQEFARAWADVELDEKLLAFDEYRARNHGIQQVATLCWFDALSGEGVISLADGSRISAHFTAIEGVDKNNYTWPTDEDRIHLQKLDYNTPILVTPYISYGSCMAEKIVIFGLKE